MTENPVAASALTRVALVVGKFRDMDADATVAAFATTDGGTARLTYGDIREVLLSALNAGDRLGRISSWHSRETADGGMVGDFCNECGAVWPCDTRRMADGTYEDETEINDEAKESAT